ncbi:hypothetical protein HOY82DRAFT_595899 [Tuber indicum]|nr:hypothetical protein HOY82DRAFT_595899 [Tuber indicum]
MAEPHEQPTNTAQQPDPNQSPPYINRNMGCQTSGVTDLLSAEHGDTIIFLLQCIQQTVQQVKDKVDQVEERVELAEKSIKKLEKNAEQVEGKVTRVELNSERNRLGLAEYVKNSLQRFAGVFEQNLLQLKQRVVRVEEMVNQAGQDLQQLGQMMERVEVEVGQTRQDIHHSNVMPIRIRNGTTHEGEESRYPHCLTPANPPRPHPRRGQAHMTGAQGQAAATYLGVPALQEGAAVFIVTPLRTVLGASRTPTWLPRGGFQVGPDKEATTYGHTEKSWAAVDGFLRRVSAILERVLR